MTEMKNNYDKILEYRETFKPYLRFILMAVCAFGMVSEVWELQSLTQQISAPEFARYQMETLYYESETNNNQPLGIDVSKLTTNTYAPHNIYDSKEWSNTKIIPYNAISEAIWSLVNLVFYLFLISLLWRNKEQVLKD